MDAEGQSHHRARVRRGGWELETNEQVRQMLRVFIIGVFAWSACDHVGRRRFVIMKAKATLVANVKPYAVMRAMQAEEY